LSLFQFKGNDKTFEAITQDISQSGLMFRSFNFIPNGRKLRLEIYQPLNYNKDTSFAIPAEAQADWIKQARENNENFIGVKITKMNEKHQDSLAFLYK